MDHSPNKTLGDIIKVENSDISKLNVYNLFGEYFVSGPAIRDFLRENEIENQDILIESIIEKNHISYIHILDESCLYDTILSENNFVLIDESINPLEVQKALKGRSLMDKFINQATAFITNREYDNDTDLDRYIKRCDKMINEIHEEKKAAKNKEKTSKGAFSLWFIIRIAERVFSTFFMPLILKNIHIQLPDSINDIFNVIDTKTSSGKLGKIRKVGRVVSKVYDYGTFAISTSQDLAGIYLSIADYDRLLDNYERQLRKVRTNLYSQKQSLQKKEN